MAIFQDQPINLETVKGVSPERFVQRAEREQQAVVGNFLRMQQGIQAGIQEFEQKRAEKQNMQASLQLLKELGAVEGLSDESIKAGIKNAGGATNFLKTLGEMQAMEQQERLLEAQIKAAGTPKLSAFEEKRQALREAGFSPQEATMRAASGQTIQVGPSGEPSIDPALLKQQLDADVDVLNKEIIPAINAAPFIQKMEQILNQEGAEGIITGALAKPELFLKSLGADLGMNFPDVASTKEYVANAGRQVGAIIRLFGAGTGLSDADREYAQQIAGGNIEVPIDALKRIVRAAKEASLGQIDRYNARVRRKYSEDTGLTPQQVAFSLGSLLIPEEERSLFQSPESLPGTDANEEDEVEGLLRDLGIE